MNDRAGIVGAIALCVPLLAPLIGCEANPLGMKKGATSILDAVQLPTPAEAVDMALDPYDANRRYQGTQLLAGAVFAGEPLYMELFEKLLDDKDPGVRGAAVRAVGLHGQPTHVPRLVERLKDPDPNVRIEAGRALQRLHNPVAIDGLLAAIDPAKEPESAVRVEAAKALGQYPESIIVEKLITSLADDSLAVNAATASSLRTLTGQDFGYDRAGWQRWYGATDAPFAAKAVYAYEGYNRPKRWWEHLPFVPRPPHEPSAIPTGLDPTAYTPAVRK